MSLDKLFADNAYEAHARKMAEAKAANKSGTAMDGALLKGDLSQAEMYTLGDLTAKAAGIVSAWAETSDLSDNETYSQRLDALIMGCCDMDGNGEIGDDENDCYQMVWGLVGDYMQAKGASYDDVEAIANKGDEAAATRVMELIAESLPDGVDAEIDEINSWAFDDESTGSIFDNTKAETAMDATYKKQVMIRGGKKVRKNVRVSGTVHLSGAQKAGLKKAQMKSHSAGAQMKRMKSLKVRKKFGL